MKNKKLNLNKSTVANLSSEQMAKALGGFGGDGSSKSDCCMSIANNPDPGGSSARRCCSCPAETSNDVHGTGG